MWVYFGDGKRMSIPLPEEHTPREREVEDEHDGDDGGGRGGREFEELEEIRNNEDTRIRLFMRDIQERTGIPARHQLLYRDGGKFLLPLLSYPKPIFMAPPRLRYDYYDMTLSRFDLFRVEDVNLTLVEADGTSTAIRACTDETISQIKDRIVALKRVEKDSITLIYDGRHMDADHFRLYHYGIERDSLIHIASPL